MSSPGTLRFGQVATKPSAPPVGYDLIYVKTDDVVYVQDSSGVEVALGSATAITSLTGDVSAVGPGSAVATVNFIGGASAANVASATAEVMASTSSDTPSTLVLRDGSGNFSAGIITASLSGNSTTSTTSTNFSGSLSGDVTGTQTATSIASTVVTGKLLTGYIPGTNTPISGTNSILTALENLQAQIDTTTGSAITQLTGDVSAVGPGSAAATVNSVGGSSAANIHSAELAANAATSINTSSTIVERNASGNFAASIITANLTGNVTGNVSGSSSTFTGSLSGDVTGTQSATVVSLVGGKSATDVASATTTVEAATSINTASTLVERDASGNFAAGTIIAALSGNATTATTAINFSGALSGDVTGTQSATSISSTVVTGKLLTGYAVGSNTPLSSTDSILLAFEKIQGQLNATTSSAITALTGDVSAVGPGSVAATIQPNVVTNPKLAQMSANTVKANITGSTANPSDVALGTLTETTSAILALTGWADATIGSPTITVKQATAIQSGYLSSTDWNTFNNKQSAGNYITALTGQVTASGPGSAVATIATNTVTNTNLAQMPTNTLKGNNTGGTANASDLTISQVVSLLGAVTTVGSYNGGTANANGATITSPNIFFQSASISFPGMVDNTIQSFSGAKTFTGNVSISTASTTALTLATTAFIFDSTDQALGIGIQPSTTAFIDAVNSTAASKTLQLTGYGVGSTVGTRGRFARGTSGTPTAVQTGDIINFWSARGYGASQFAAASTAAINAIAGENFTNASNLTYLTFNTTPTGSVTSTENFRVASTGVTLGPQTASTSIHQINGGIYRTNKTITANYTIDTTTTDDIIFCNQSAAITITLPIPTSGRSFLIKDVSGTTQTNTITLVRHASEKIEGLAASRILYTNFGSWTVTSDGTNWWLS